MTKADLFFRPKQDAGAQSVRLYQLFHEVDLVNTDF